MQPDSGSEALGPGGRESGVRFFRQVQVREEEREKEKRCQGEEGTSKGQGEGVKQTGKADGGEMDARRREKENGRIYLIKEARRESCMDRVKDMG
jgi:hypothetical protein